MEVGELAWSCGNDPSNMAFVAEAFWHGLKSYGIDGGHRLVHVLPQDANSLVWKTRFLSSQWLVAAFPETILHCCTLSLSIYMAFDD
jgi:hypothetical protein